MHVCGWSFLLILLCSLIFLNALFLRDVILQYFIHGVLIVHGFSAVQVGSWSSFLEKTGTNQTGGHKPDPETQKRDSVWWIWRDHQNPRKNLPSIGPWMRLTHGLSLSRGSSFFSLLQLTVQNATWPLRQLLSAKCRNLPSTYKKMSTAFLLLYLSDVGFSLNSETDNLFPGKTSTVHCTINCNLTTVTTIQHLSSVVLPLQPCWGKAPS